MWFHGESSASCHRLGYSSEAAHFLHMAHAQLSHWDRETRNSPSGGAWATGNFGFLFLVPRFWCSPPLQCPRLVDRPLPIPESLVEPGVCYQGVLPSECLRPGAASSRQLLPLLILGLGRFILMVFWTKGPGVSFGSVRWLLKWYASDFFIGGWA